MTLYPNDKLLRQYAQRLSPKEDGRKDYYNCGIFPRENGRENGRKELFNIGVAPRVEDREELSDVGLSRENGRQDVYENGLSRLVLSNRPSEFRGRKIFSGETGCSCSNQAPIEIEDEENVLQNLLPGIPDRITIEGILTKTSWSTLCTLVAVNRAWRRAIQSRRVFKARNYINSTKTLVVACHKASVAGFGADGRGGYTRSGRSVPVQWRYAISIYNPKEDFWHRLPPIPGVSSGIPKSCGCLFLDGKLYVIGGEHYDKVHSTREVYRIDLAGCRRVWERCADMKSRRSEFPTAVHNERIYVFGGGYQSEMNYSRDAEVFDPARNQWHSIEDMLHQRTNHTVVSLDGKLFIIGGSVWLEDDDDVLYQRLDCDDMFDSTLHGTFAEVYDPWNRSWRKVEKVTKRETDDAFVVVHGKLHVLRPDSVHVYDTSSNSWTFIQHISWEVQACVGAKDCCICGVAFVNGELLALVGRIKEDDYGLSLLKSKNFGRRNSEVTWEAISSPHEYDSQFYSLFPIQL